MKTIPDFAVSSQEAGFDKFLKVLNECNGTRWKGHRMFYGIVDNCAWTSNKKWGKELSPSEAIALLTGKQLTEEEKPTIENACFYHDGSDEAKELYRACCKMLGFEKESDGYEGSFTIVNNTQKCIEGLTIVKHGYVQVSISDYFKLLPTQESVNEIDTFIADHDRLSLKMANEEISHLQKQLKQAKELLLEAELIFRKHAIVSCTRVSINQFLTRNQ